MKTIHESFIEHGGQERLALSVALLLLAFVFASSPASGQTGNTATGDHALFNNTTGDDNTADGYFALFRNTTGSYNTATGSGALSYNTTGIQNTASGYHALLYNTPGSYNTATGFSALTNNTSGNSNTATGTNTLYSNHTGGLNTATGDRALSSNTTGSYNTANGGGALSSNINGIDNTASGVNALYSNTSGHYNTADGFSALYHNTTGAQNMGIGVNALLANTTGGRNTASGVNALLRNTTGSSNIALGHSAGASLTTGSNNIDIGHVGVAAEGNTIRIGTTQSATYVAGISGKAVPGGVGVIVGANGKLGTVVSSQRFKEEVKPMDKMSEALLALRPVTFRYKQEVDPERIAQFGLIAEEVEKVNPALVARDEKGKVYTVRYEAVNAMLLNEFLKEHRKVEQQRKDFEAALARQHKQIEALTAGLQKVSAHLEASKPAPQVANNP